MGLLTVKQAAERTGVSESLVYGWCGAELLAHMRLGRPGRRGCIRIMEEDLDAFLRSQKREGRQALSRSALKLPKLKNLSLD
jgi:excisionase family DNA binding protein